MTAGREGIPTHTAYVFARRIASFQSSLTTSSTQIAQYPSLSDGRDLSSPIEVARVVPVEWMGARLSFSN
jgi:hypothetical protein